MLELKKLAKRSMVYFFAIHSALLGPVANAELPMPGVDEIAKIKETISELEAMSDMTKGALAVGGLMLGGAAGTAAITEGLGEVVDKQREPWGAEDEYAYALKNDLGNFPKMIECMQYMIVGSCMSVVWTAFGPKFTWSFAVEHFVRDLHVETIPQAPSIDVTEVVKGSVYPSSNSLAEDVVLMYPYTWKLGQTAGSLLMLNPISKVLEMAQGSTSKSSQNDYLYNDVQVSGNMEKNMYDAIAGSWLSWAGYCNVPTMSGLAYFSSPLDQFSWRWLATSEIILTGLYQAHHLSWDDIGNNYGSTMPRSGYLVTPNRFKSSVVSAVRGVSIAAENRFMYSGLAGLHIYTPLPEYASSSFMGGVYQTPQDSASIKFDMVYPYQDSLERCTRFKGKGGPPGLFQPHLIAVDDKRSTLFNNTNPNGSAIYKFYRPFRCCTKRGNRVYSATFPGPIGVPK